MSKLTRSSIVGIIAIVVSGSVLGDDWNTGAGGNSARNCLSQELGPESAELLWQGSLPAIVAQQAVIDGTVVVTNRIGSFTIPTGTWIVAHDLNSGDLLWQQQLPFDFPDSWRSRATAMRDGRVFATRAGNTNLDYLYALNVIDGSILWQSEDLIDEGTTESLAFTSNGNLISGNFGSLLCIDATDGTTVWETSRSCPTSGGCQAAVFGERVYIWEASPSGPVISVFDAQDGSYLYSSDGIGGGFVQQVGPLVGPDGTVYAPRTQNNPVSDFLVAYEDTGAELLEKWNRPLGYVPFGTFGVGPDGSVYTYETDASTITILRLDPASGDVLDTAPGLVADFPAAPRMAVDAAGKIFFTNGGFASGMLFSFDADLTPRWSAPVPSVNVGGPALGEGGVLVVCGVGTDVRAYRTEAPSQSLIRGDGNGDGVVDIADPIWNLEYLFSGGPLLCEDAQDTNDDGAIDVADPIYNLGFLFSGEAPPPAPHPQCGPDPTPDLLECTTLPACP